MGDQSGRQQLSHALSDLLARSGMTKSQLASDGKLSRTTVHAAFSPDSPPPSDRTLELIAEKLDADPVPLRNLLAIARNEEAAQPRESSVIRVVTEQSEGVLSTYRVETPPDPRLDKYSFDPLRPENLVRSVVQRLRAGRAYELAEAAYWATKPGIYAIFYTGANQLYAPIAGSPIPLYVGAVQSASGAGKAYSRQHTVGQRLEEHRRTLEQSRDLDPRDFMFRVLFIDDLFMGATIDALTTQFKPLWNTTIEGFGNRNPGKARRLPRPKWHELHAGPDSWAADLESRWDRAALVEQVGHHFWAWYHEDTE
ncbi:Eco29kI family restriction endonuclease [Kitasatospora cineracea]|uniref:Eco29kI restriction endonuclease n=1 Tax=Kitasatospora cineracea TaxID=88074 RepID=A0A8G1UH69_9ACTN|nr:Eco29kI family restriction endonuclease [Kitasatospora cineracea]ROR42974.1 Eco29kI restriction endonuclease [Kitasatospora cineracea]